MALLRCVLAQAKFDFENYMFLVGFGSLFYEHLSDLLLSIIFSVVSVGSGDAVISWA